MYEKTLIAGWGDMDFNAHMRNTAYLDKAADVRLMFFAEHGFPAAELARLQIGPVIQKDELEYFREVGLLGRLHVRLALVGLAADGSRFRIRNEFLDPEGRPCARVTSHGGWLDLASRRLVAPPPLLADALRAMPRTPDFEILPGRTEV